MEHLPCTFCLGSRALLLGAGAVKPRERLAPAPLTCPRCRAPSYCSYECGQMAAQMHDALCFDASASDGAAIAAADATLAALTEESDPAEYARVLRREKELFLQLWKRADVEAGAFPLVFMFGSGHFGALMGRTRFHEYRDHILHHFSVAPRMWDDGGPGLWVSWAASTQGMLDLALRNERLGRPQGWDVSKRFNEARFAAFRKTLTPRGGVAPAPAGARKR